MNKLLGSFVVGIVFFSSFNASTHDGPRDVKKYLLKKVEYCDKEVREAKTSLWITRKDREILFHLRGNTSLLDQRIRNLEQELNGLKNNCYGQET